MVRFQRIAPLGIYQRIIQRGNNRQVYFASDQEVAFWMRWVLTINGTSLTFHSDYMPEIANGTGCWR